MRRMATVLLLCVAGLFTAMPAHAQPLRVMTFNVRLPLEQDGANRWEARRDLMVDVLRAENADVIGTQELHKHQGDELLRQLPGYEWFGEGRRGGEGDEHMGVFYRKDRLRVRASGNFWLSDAPDVPGSITWGNLFPRMVTWAQFERIGDGLRFVLFNTHLPYRTEDESARVRSAELINARLRELSPNEIVILVGDFNDTPESRTHAALTTTLTDALTASPKRSGPDATFHGFTGKADRRIDWILFRGLRVKQIKTVTTNRDGRYPSDHFPVVAEFEVLEPQTKMPSAGRASL